MSEEIVYNSINWKSQYDFTLSFDGAVGFDDLPSPRNRGVRFISGSNTPLTEPVNFGLSQCSVNGVIQKTTNSGLLTTVTIFKSALRLLVQANVFKELYFTTFSDVKWNAIPDQVIVRPIGGRSLATKAKVTVTFFVESEYSDIP